MANDKRTAIVTGASRGIGRAIGLALGAEHFNVVVNFHSNAGAAEAVVAQIREQGGDGIAVQADMGNLAGHPRLLATALERFGDVHLLVNNAGVAPKVRADLLEISEESYDHVLDTDLKGAFFLTQRVARHMVERGGHAVAGAMPRAIVNISSISVYTASVNRGEYCLAKAGMSMMTQLFAARLAEQGINVYEIRPGIIATDMTASPAVKAKYDDLIEKGDLLPIARWGRPEDVAQAVLAIAKGLFPYSTGQVFDIDGGFHLRRL